MFIDTFLSQILVTIAEHEMGFRRSKESSYFNLQIYTKIIDLFIDPWKIYVMTRIIINLSWINSWIIRVQFMVIRVFFRGKIQNCFKTSDILCKKCFKTSDTLLLFCSKTSDTAPWGVWKSNVKCQMRMLLVVGGVL